MYKMKDVTSEMTIPLSTIRYYERQGIVIGKRQENGYRIFDEADKILLEYLIVMKHVGFSVEEMKELLNFLKFPENDECSERSEQLLSKKEAEIKQKIKHEKMVLTLIKELKPKIIAKEYEQYEPEINKKISDIYQEIKQSKLGEK
ncbi:MerR family transcriptional regulator [Enterococcus rotai]|uniref:MerR family transcriptional regulator n=1 Tax=Enterococcus rotai TaxID=118060 RepID=UPI0032B41C6C